MAFHVAVVSNHLHSPAHLHRDNQNPLFELPISTMQIPADHVPLSPHLGLALANSMASSSLFM